MLMSKAQSDLAPGVMDESWLPGGRVGRTPRPSTTPVSSRLRAGCSRLHMPCARTWRPDRIRSSGSPVKIGGHVNRAHAVRLGGPRAGHLVPVSAVRLTRDRGPTKTTRSDPRACCARSSFEPYCFLRATSGVARAVRMRTHPNQLAALNDQVLIADRTAAEPALQDFAHSRGVARLCR